MLWNCPQMMMIMDKVWSPIETSALPLYCAHQMPMEKEEARSVAHHCLCFDYLNAVYRNPLTLPIYCITPHSMRYAL